VRKSGRKLRIVGFLSGYAEAVARLLVGEL
jgi:hypothetical protein